MLSRFSYRLLPTCNSKQQCQNYWSGHQVLLQQKPLMLVVQHLFFYETLFPSLLFRAICPYAKRTTATHYTRKQKRMWHFFYCRSCSGLLSHWQPFCKCCSFCHGSLWPPLQDRRRSLLRCTRTRPQLSCVRVAVRCGAPQGHGRVDHVEWWGLRLGHSNSQRRPSPNYWRRALYNIVLITTHLMR